MAIDPITLEVIRNRFDIICDEMQAILRRSCRSAIIKEGADALNAIFDTRGQFIAQSISIPCHLGMIIPGVQRILEVFPPTQMKEGDVYVLNDPHQGGTHLPDVIIVTPVIYKSEVVALTACIAHQADIGGKAYSGKAMDATEIFAEGLVIPPLKLYDEGRRNETLYKMIASNVRLPQIVESDLQAQLAACTVGKKRVVSLFEQYSQKVVFESVAELMDRSELMTRKEIGKIPEGIYNAVDYVDCDGVEMDKPVRIEVTITVKGQEMVVDFAGTSPQTKGPINSTLGSSMSSVYFAIRAVTDPNIPGNAGCYRPIKILLPRGSVVNPLPPAPVNARVPTISVVADVMVQALAKAVPDKVTAIPAFTSSPVFGGKDPLTGETFVFMDFIAGGVGARPKDDGVDAREPTVGNCSNIPAEVVEMSYPLRVKEFNLWEDSCGAGKYQGGLGTVKIYEVLRGECLMGFQGERQKTAPIGLFGGKPAKKQATYIISKDGKRKTVPSKAIGIPLKEGDQVIVYITGGGGFGDPGERDRERIRRDILDGRISRKFARREYGYSARGKRIAK